MGSLAQDRQIEVNQLLEEETDRVVRHLSAKLPKDVLEHLDVAGGFKEKLFSYFHRNYRNMFNPYMATEDVTPRYSPREIAGLLDSLGGGDKFNTGEIEKSLVSMYGHLQGHILREIDELEARTNGMLRQKTGVGAFIPGENAYSVVKCSFKDNVFKPKTVTDLKLAVNVLDSELISPIFHHQVTEEYLVRDLLSKHLVDSIDKTVEELKDERIDQGLEELSEGEILLGKISQAGNYGGTDDSRSGRCALAAKAIMERLEGPKAGRDSVSFDPANPRENVKKILDTENIRDRGFNTAVNSLVSILENARLGYQCIENFKNAREALIREYEERDPAVLPDERYEIRLRYFDDAQLLEDRRAYDLRIKSFETEARRLWDMVELSYRVGGIRDFADLFRKRQGRLRGLNENSGGDEARSWDEAFFVKSGETDVEKSNPTYVYEKDRLGRMFPLTRSRLEEVFDCRYPRERRVIEARLDKLEKEYRRFEHEINPYHLQRGLLVELDITSIKRKKTTLDAMAGVLGEFLRSVSRGFQDAAFASAGRGGGAELRPPEAVNGGSSPAPAYLDLINSGSGAMSEPEAKVSRRGRKPRGRGGSGLKEL